MGGKLIALSGVEVAVHILLNASIDLFGILQKSIAKTESVAQGGVLYYLGLFLLLLSIPLYLLTVFAATFTTFGYLFGSFWVVGERAPLRAILPKLWELFRSHKKAFWKHGGSIWRAILLPSLAILVILILFVLIVVIVMPKNMDSIGTVTILFMPIASAINIILLFAEPFAFAALFSEKGNRKLQFLYFEHTPLVPLEPTSTQQAAIQLYTQKLWGKFCNLYFTHFSIETSGYFYHHNLLTQENLRISCESYVEHFAHLEDELDELAVEFGELVEDFPIQDSSFRAFLNYDREAVGALLKLAENLPGEYLSETCEALIRANELVERMEEWRLTVLLLAGCSREDAEAVIQEGRAELAETKVTLRKFFTEEQAQFDLENPVESFIC